MATFRIDYLTETSRGTWDYEEEYPSLAHVKNVLEEKFKFAKSRLPEIVELVVVEVTEEDVARIS